jgi:CRISPR-associated protein Cas1
MKYMGQPYYLINSGSLLKSGDSITFNNKNENINIPLETIDEILVYGNVNFTTPVLKLLSDKKIPIFLYSRYGWYITSIYPENFLQSGFVLTHQAMFYNNMDLRIDIAKRFVLGAGKNMRRVIQKLNVGTLKLPLNEIENSKTISELMGVEGNIHIKYLELLDIKLPDDFKVVSRTRLPPKNYINSMMSYLYSVLYGIVAGEIYSTHLSPEISFLHEPSERRSSLSLDVAEIFRPIFCDRVILKLINLKIMKKTDFVDNNGIFLNEYGKRKILEEFENKLRETVYSPSVKRKVSNRTLIRLELYKIEKHIMENRTYKPYITRD